MAKVKEYSELKKRALLAKQRMRMGYWQALNDERNKVLLESGNSSSSLIRVKEIQQARIERDINRTLGNVQALKDEEFYVKVSSILDKDEDISNPIGMLVEHEIYDNLDPSNKQRYILELSKKFIQMRERYYRERTDRAASL